MPQRQNSGRRMRLNHSGALPRYIIALDTETLPHPMGTDGKRFSHQFRLGVAVSARLVGLKPVGKKIHRFRTIDELWTVLKSLTAANYTTWVVCHNTLFDMVVAGMPGEFENGSLGIDWPRSKRAGTTDDNSGRERKATICIESPPTIIAARCGATQGRIVFVDTLNWFQCSLRELGNACGLEKMEMPPFSAPDSEWFEYCQRDTEITFETFLALIRWVKENDMGMFRYTGPSQAIAAYRHRCMTHEILIHDNLPIKVVERSGYFGGRFECFRLGRINETIHQFDANALFPSVMLYNHFPCALDSYHLDSTYKPWPDDLDPRCAIAEVILDTTDYNYPYREKRGVAYPTGRFATTLCGPELAIAVQSGKVLLCRSWARYRLEPIFTKWVNELWAMRQGYKESGNKLYEQFAKMLMNSLYGKFGQRSPEWESVPERMDALPWMTWADYNSATGERTVYRSFGWQVQRQLPREDRHHAEMPVDDWETHAKRFSGGEIDSSFTAVSAFVTSYARCAMNRMRKIAGRSNVYYQGVDSLVVNNQGKMQLENAEQIHPTELGKMRLQLSADHGEIAGCSDYRIGDKVVIAGLSRNRILPNNTTKLQRTFSAKEHLFRGYASSEVIEEISEWRKRQEYWKGTVGQDGTVCPLVLSGI